MSHISWVINHILSACSIWTCMRILIRLPTCILLSKFSYNFSKPACIRLGTYQENFWKWTVPHLVEWGTVNQHSTIFSFFIPTSLNSSSPSLSLSPSHYFQTNQASQPDLPISPPPWSSNHRRPKAHPYEEVEGVFSQILAAGLLECWIGFGSLIEIIGGEVECFGF